MPARKLISEECQDPDALSRTIDVFEEAWAVIAEGFAFDPVLADAVRLRLARIILNSPSREVQDIAQIKAASLQILALSYPSHAATIRYSMSHRGKLFECKSKV
jgi:hypothetical protein